MRVTPFLSLLPAVLAAEEQKPLADRLKAWFNKASDYVEASIPSVIPDPLDAGAAKVAEVAVHHLNVSNFKSTLVAPARRPVTKGAPTQEEWLIFVNGGNKKAGTNHRGQ